MKRAAVITAFALLAGCRAAAPPAVMTEWQGRTLYTCCNVHYEGASINDANYTVGSTLPFGSPVTVVAMTTDSITFQSGPTKLTLRHSYGAAQETAQQYFNKILVDTDPHLRCATFPKMVQSAIEDGRVERGMTKEQVIMSLGYPPTHRTASTDLSTWTYWYNRWVTFEVMFDTNGVVTNTVGNAPTRNEPIQVPTPTPLPAKRGKKR
jgi:hypothetical protein